MNRPNNYAETQAQGDFKPVELGGHKMIVKKVEEKKSSTGKDMLVVYFDFAKDDVQPEYFAEAYKNDICPEKKWSNQATSYILTEDENGNCTKNFKTFCTVLENSNPGFSCWKNDDTFNFDGCKGKRVGGVFGEQMDYYNGNETKKRVLRWFRSIDKVMEAPVPDMCSTKAWKNYQNVANPKMDADGFMNIPDGLDEDLPFN